MTQDCSSLHETAPTPLNATGAGVVAAAAPPATTAQASAALASTTTANVEADVERIGQARAGEVSSEVAEAGRARETRHSQTGQ